ncbi:MAG: formylglycine-generating enzyme family protein [Lentisphaerae bacterium]|nr:formylglycine-generating enzyme family protein [Lentisphaerota bacterium]
MEKSQENISKPPKKRFSRLRLAIWAIEILVLLTCLEHFIIRPRLARKKQGSESQWPAVPPNRGEVIRPLADAALLPPGLQESFPAYYPPLSILTPEGLNMLETQKALSAERGLPLEVVNSIGMKFRLVPPGNCLIGSPETEAGRGFSELQHFREFPEPFYMGMYEVTQAQWEAVMGQESNHSHFRAEQNPVEEVSWYDCQEFVQKLCQMEQLDSLAYRLPSEEEWEYACRAGTSTAYCFGDQPDKLTHWADYEANNFRRPNTVGKRLPNALGLFDMHGNVWEWCRDKYKNYPGDFSPEKEYHSWRNIRGGNWYVDASSCRSANRCRLPGMSVGNMLGFRIIRTLPPATAETAPQDAGQR